MSELKTIEQRAKMCSRDKEWCGVFNLMKQVAELTTRAEQAERLYRVSSGIVDEYQKEIIPGFRDRAEQAEAWEKVLREALKPFALFGERAKDFTPNPNRPDDWSIKTDRINFVKAYEAITGDGENKQ